jgi:hypothetical protein
MKATDNIEKLIRKFCTKEKLCVKTSTEMDKRVLDDALVAYEKSRKKILALIRPNIWRTFIKSRITKLAIAAVIIVIAALSITFLDKSVTPAYALEQTIEANRAMRYIHTMYLDSSHDDVAKECWLEFDQAGQLKNVRINWSEWMGGGEIVVWNQSKTQIWQKKQNRLITFNDEIYTSRIHNMAETDDPRLMVEHLYQRQTKGEIGIEIDEPAAKAEPIIVTATGLGTYTKRFILFVDQATKLVTACEWYQLKEGKYKYQGVMEYYDYNVPIDAKIFSINDDVSPDAELIDTRTQNIGLAQGNLTDKEIAVEVVAKDYVKAGQICGGLSSAEIQQEWGKLNVVRIVSMDEPVPPSETSKLFPKMQCVHYTIEVEKDGKKIIQEKQNNVRRVLGRRDRWVIHQL